MEKQLSVFMKDVSFARRSKGGDNSILLCTGEDAPGVLVTISVFDGNLSKRNNIEVILLISGYMHIFKILSFSCFCIINSLSKGKFEFCTKHNPNTDFFVTSFDIKAELKN